MQILKEELARTDILPKNYDFESDEEFVPMQLGDVPDKYADNECARASFSTLNLALAFEQDCGSLQSLYVNFVFWEERHDEKKHYERI